MNTKQKVIAIDGPSASGKGTVASRVAQALGFDYLDSGALYRLTALYAKKRDVEWSDEEAVAELAENLPARFEGTQVFLDDEDVSGQIRSEAIGMGASAVAQLPKVRAALLQRQRDFLTGKGLVADGRDMGTVVFPDAPLKFFLTASAEIRAERRYKQLLAQGESVNLRAIYAEIAERDARDRSRSVAPLKPASDAVVIDTGTLSIADVQQQVNAEIAARFSFS